MERRTALVLIVLTLVPWSPAGAGTPEVDFCREDALGSPGPQAYARRGGYCDGAVFEVNAGDGELPVIGVTVAPIVGTPRNQAVSITTMALPATLSGIAWPLHLQGVVRSPRINYRFDAALSSGRSLVIGPESAMSKLGKPLRAEDVAWAAWSDSSRDGRTYVPVMMPAATAGDVQLVVRPTIPVAYVVYSVEDPSGAVLKPRTGLPLAGDPDKRAEPITLGIPAGKPELVIVKAVAVGNNGETQVATVRLVRPGSAVH